MKRTLFFVLGLVLAAALLLPVPTTVSATDATTGKLVAAMDIHPGMNVTANPDTTGTGFVFPTGRKPNCEHSYGYGDAISYYSKDNAIYAGWLARGDQPYNDYYPFINHFHIAQDIPAEDNDNVFAITSGVIVYLHEDKDGSKGWGAGNYGVFVRHQLVDGTTFVALYGHIRPLEGKKFKIDQYLEGGRAFARIGPYSPPHLHFGVLKDRTSPPSTYEDTNNQKNNKGWGRMGLNNWGKAWPNGTNYFVNPIQWITTKTPLSSSGGHIDIALIIDDSGSMAWNDSSFLRKEAANIFIDVMQDGDQISIVSFNSSSSLLWNIQVVGSDRTNLKASLNSLNSYGGTSLSAALLAGYQQLLNAESSGNKKAAVFLTDGVGDYSNEAHLFGDKGWPIYVLGLGNEINGPLLQLIADDSGGLYQHLDKANQLQNVYNEIATTISGGKVVLNHQQTMNPGQTIWQIIKIVAPTFWNTFLASWGGSTVNMTLIGPDNTTIGPDSIDPNVYHAKGLTYELYKVFNPLPGEWTIVLYGQDLPQGGENVSVQVSVLEQTTGVDTDGDGFSDDEERDAGSDPNNPNSRPPISRNDIGTTNKNTQLVINVLTNDYDPDGGMLVVDSVDTSDTMGLVINNGSYITYNPNGQYKYLKAGESEVDSFTYSVSDGEEAKSTATVSIVVNGINDIPAVPGLSQWGIIGLAGLFSGAVGWMIRRKQIRERKPMD
jgi:hypothetical protein